MLHQVEDVGERPLDALARQPQAHRPHAGRVDQPALAGQRQQLGGDGGVAAALVALADLGGRLARPTPSRALTSVDLPMPLAPRNASVRPPAANARSVVDAGAAFARWRRARARRGRPRRARGGPARDRRRGRPWSARRPARRRCRTPARARARGGAGSAASPNEWVRKTTSMLAASVSATRPGLPSNEARRTNAERRGRTCSTRSPSSDGTTQSPTATSAPMLRTRRVPSIRRARCSSRGRAGSPARDAPVPPCSCHARSRSSSQPSDRSAPSAPIRWPACHLRL